MRRNHTFFSLAAEHQSSIDKNYKSDCFFLCINRMENTSEHKLNSVAEDNICGQTLSQLEATLNKIQYPLLAFHFNPYTLIGIHLIWWLINHSQLQFGDDIFGAKGATISLTRTAKLSSRWTMKNACSVANWDTSLFRHIVYRIIILQYLSQPSSRNS